MHRILEAKPLSEFRVWIRFENGAEGEVNLSELVGEGVFAAWNDPDFFAKVAVDPETHTLAWPGGIDLCPDALFDDLETARRDRPGKANTESATT
ncbi:MAG: DUF2442 domain-containing protein [Deltaproteobacteria bacterium]|nr:DUF2442 domain-containing protein [Deltaproteobacteria bacterium]